MDYIQENKDNKAVFVETEDEKHAQSDDRQVRMMKALMKILTESGEK